ncbi:MAG: TonB-dependent receptor [Cyclobacteriaceae bacterium]|nr:TonB-dependent receptor [Cyclobacteriaceae bacterium]
MKKFYLGIFFVIASFVTFAQKAMIKGQVTDTLSSSLPSSTVMILSLKDSSLVNFGVTDAKGIFEIRNVNKGEYLLKITFVGFTPYLNRIATTVDPVLDLGRIKMEPLTKELDGVVIMGEKNPVTVKKDTIEFNAGSFKTKTNATVEDLLKVMPGMEVETDGTVRAQGEQVQRVTVDGREFFGRDPKLATRNLPADAIDKVQVFDRKSDQAQFTGIDDGQREKTINLELKEEKRKGAFGNLMGGYGSDNRFQATASVNKFSKGKQLSFLGMGNNINEQGFSIGDFMNFSGGTQTMMGGGGVNISINSSGGGGSGPAVNFGGRQSGIMTNYAGGLNFNRDLNKDTKLTSSYFYNHLDRNVNTDLNRINFLPTDANNPGVDKSNELNQLSRQISKSDNHKGTLMLDHNLDSANTIKAAANANYSVSNQRTISTAETRNVSDNAILNESTRNTDTDQTALSLNTSLLWRHRFEKKGRSISTNLTMGLSTTDSEGNQQSTNKYYSNTPGEQQLDQTNTQSTNNQSYGATVSFTEPLGGRKYLEANYNFQTNRNDVNREVFDVGGGTPIFNTQLSNKYISNYIYNRPGLNFKINREKFSLTTGASYQMTSLKGDLISRDVKIDRTFENLLPSTHFNYDFSTTKHLRIDYETSMQEPTIQQLQPVIDNSDPLNLYVGNPELKPGYVHRLNTNFTSFNPARFINFFAFINASYTKNAIVNSQTFNGGNRLTMPVNVDYSKSLRGNFNFGFPIKKINSRFNFGPSATLSETIAVLNGQNNNARSRTLGGNSRYNFTYKEIVILDLSANLNQQETQYDFSTPDQQFFNQTYKAEINLSFLKKYSFNTSYEYLIYTSKTTDFRQEIPFLDISISRFILKNNAGELKFKVNNVLDQSNSVNQSSGENYIQQQTTNNLGRFYMVSFTYALNKHLNPMGGGGRRGGGGMRMIIQQ